MNLGTLGLAPAALTNAVELFDSEARTAGRLGKVDDRATDFDGPHEARASRPDSRFSLRRTQCVGRFAFLRWRDARTCR